MGKRYQPVRFNGDRELLIMFIALCALFFGAAHLMVDTNAGEPFDWRVFFVTVFFAVLANLCLAVAAFIAGLTTELVNWYDRAFARVIGYNRYDQFV